MREGASTAERPKLGRPAKPKDTPSLSSNTKSGQSGILEKNSNAASASTVRGDSAGTTDSRQQNNVDISNSRPITDRENSLPPNRPIRARNGNPPKKTARIQTSKPPNPNGPIVTREMMDQWSPEVFQAAGSPDFTVREPRTTRNPSPNYVGAIWSASESEIATLNAQISGLRY